MVIPQGTNSFAQPGTGQVLLQAVQSPRGRCMPLVKSRECVREIGSA